MKINLNKPYILISSKNDVGILASTDTGNISLWNICKSHSQFLKYKILVLLESEVFESL